ncbi:MAG: hypothetical protein AAF658_17000, partial [Myxococcota bacterium]
MAKPPLAREFGLIVRPSARRTPFFKFELNGFGGYDALPYGGSRLNDHPEALLDTRGGGVLIVDDDSVRAARWIEPIRSLYVEVEHVASLAEAREQVSAVCPPRVVVTQARVGGASAETWCQQIRSDAQHSSSAIVVLLDSEAARGLWADDYLRAPIEVDALRHSVRAMLRAYAVRRNVWRRERRRAIRWLSGVVSHELNNPLAAALSNIEDALEMMEAAKSPDEIREATELTREALAYMERIREAERRLRDYRVMPRSEPQACTVEELVERLGSAIGDAPIRVRAESARDAVIDAVLLCATAESVNAAAREHCQGPVEATLAIDGGRVSILLELEG